MRAENSKAPLVVAYGVGVDSTATQYIKEQGLLSAEHVEAIQRVPKHLINYQEAFAAGMTKQPFTEFLAETLGEEVAQ
jgi:predicted PP-loop superfamily ATPase